MKRKLIALPNGKKITKDMVAKIYKLYDFLKQHAVGEKNKKSAAQIILALNDLFNTRQDVERAIQILRISEDRQIGSNTNGYWMICESDETDGYQYIKNQAISKMKVAIMSGVSPDLFFKILNEIKDKCNDTANGQVVLTDTPYQKSVVRRFSDDLIKQ